MARKPWGKSRIHWRNQRKIEELERMVRDIEERRIEITGRDPQEFLKHLRNRISKLAS